MNKISLLPLSVAFGRSVNPFGNSACAARIVLRSSPVDHAGLGGKLRVR